MTNRADIGEKDSSSGRICLLVLGMHRSGTSALSRVMALLGADLPKVLMPPNASNKAGYWESNTISRVNEELLRSAESRWDDWLAFDPAWRSTAKAEDFRTRALSALNAEFGSSSFFVLKDPRICRIVPFWLEVIEEAGVRPLVVMPVRNPLEVAASLERRDGFPPELGHLLWLRNVLEAEAASRGRPRFCCSYDQLMSDWIQIATGAEVELDLSWPRTPDQVAKEVDAFLADELRHHRETPKDVIGNPMLSSWLRDAFAILDRWAAEGEDPADFPTLDRIKAAFDDAAPAFTRLISQGQSRLRAANEALQEALSSVAADKAGRERAEAELIAAQERLREAQTASAAEKASRERAETELMAAQERLREAQTASAAEKASRERAEAQLTAVRDQLREARTAAAGERTARARAQETLTKRFDEIAALTRLLRDVQTLVRRHQDMILQSARFLPAFLRYPLQMAAIRRSGLFDAEWYGRVYKDVTASGMDPLRHFVQYGAREGRAPCAALGSGPIVTGERRKQA